MLERVRHPKIAEFLRVCSKPLAIMMEYEYCDFTRVFPLPGIGLKPLTQTLLSISFLFSKGARDVAEGLAFLHANDIVHRDLKARNVLVGNKHYMNKTVNPNEIPELFREAPVVCKLTDFGESPESRSLLLQITTKIHAATGIAERGTKPHMAPEIVNALLI